MALNLWVLDKNAHVRWAQGHRLPDGISPARLAVCEMGLLEWLYSAQSAHDFNEQSSRLRSDLVILDAPDDILARTLRLQADLANHTAMWHRMSLGDLVIAETAIHHAAGVLHADSDYDRIAEVRPMLRIAEMGPGSSQ